MGKNGMERLNGNEWDGWDGRDVKGWMGKNRMERMNGNE